MYMYMFMFECNCTHSFVCVCVCVCVCGKLKMINKNKNQNSYITLPYTYYCRIYSIKEKEIRSIWCEVECGGWVSCMFVCLCVANWEKQWCWRIVNIVNVGKKELWKVIFMVAIRFRSDCMRQWSQAEWPEHIHTFECTYINIYIYTHTRIQHNRAEWMKPDQTNKPDWWRQQRQQQHQHRDDGQRFRLRGWRWYSNSNSNMVCVERKRS